MAIPPRGTTPPTWFRLGLVAAVTLILCSCRATNSPTNSSTISLNSNPAKSDAEIRESIVSAVKLVEDRQIVQAAHKQAIPLKKAAAKELPGKSSSDKTIVDPGVVNALYTENVGSKKQTSKTRQVAHVEQVACDSCSPATMGPCVVCMPEDCGIGPADEYLCDGGDFGLPAGVRANWQIDGLEQEDTIAHYDTVDGRTIVAPSNRVCIYAPRFGVVRKAIDLHAYNRYEMPGGFEADLSLSGIEEDERAATSLNQLEPNINRAENPPSLMLEQQKAGELALDIEVREYDGALAAYADLQIIRAGIIDNEEKALIAEGVDAAITWAGDQAAQVTIDKRRAQAEVSVVQPGVVYHDEQPNNPRLRLVKLASTGTALPGDEVEFTLRFDNIGDRVIGNVTIVDNLTTRLEYIPETAQASVDAEFSAEPNKHGSVIMRWEITEPVEPGEGGILRFKCRVR